MGAGAERPVKNWQPGWQRMIDAKRVAVTLPGSWCGASSRRISSEELEERADLGRALKRGAIHEATVAKRTRRSVEEGRMELNHLVVAVACGLGCVSKKCSRRQHASWDTLRLSGTGVPAFSGRATK